MKNTLEHPYATKYGTTPRAIYDVTFKYEGEEEKTVTRYDFESVKDTLKTVYGNRGWMIRVIRYKNGEEKNITQYCCRRF